MSKRATSLLSLGMVALLPLAAAAQKAEKNKKTENKPVVETFTVEESESGAKPADEVAAPVAPDQQESTE
ncbi:MAG: hypothetical protein V2A73_09395 [Pseudomonadota bacterium]